MPEDSEKLQTVTLNPELAGRSVAVIVVNYNGRELLESCLGSLGSQQGAEFDVVLMDNGSTDGSVDYVRHNFPTVSLIKSPKNLGFAGGVNAAVKNFEADIYVVLNNDAEVEPGWLVNLINPLADKSVGATASEVIHEDDPPFERETNGSLNILLHRIPQVFTDKTVCLYPTGCAFAFTKETVQAMGEPAPFPEHYFLYYEDVAFGLILRLMGLDVKQVPESVVRHRGSVSTRKLKSHELTFHQEKNRLLTAWLIYSPLTLVKSAPLFILDGLARLILGLIGKRSLIGVMHAHFWMWMHSVYVLPERRRIQRLRKKGDEAFLNLMRWKGEID